MSTLPTPDDPFLARAAECRARGMSWEAAAVALDADPDDLRDQTRTAGPAYRRHYLAARRDVTEEACAEALFALRRELRSGDEKVRRFAADIILKLRMTQIRHHQKVKPDRPAVAPATPANKASPAAEYAAYLDSKTDDELAQLAAEMFPEKSWGIVKKGKAMAAPSGETRADEPPVPPGTSAADLEPLPVREFEATETRADGDGYFSRMNAFPVTGSAMRMLAVVLCAALVTGAVAAEPKRNPFRDGSGVATAEPPPAPKPDPTKRGPRVLRAADAGVGRLVPDATFTDLAGKGGALADFKASKFLVVAFTDTGCPLCKKYAPTLARLERAFGPKGVAFLFVNPTASDAPADIRKAVAAHGFAGRTVHDAKGTLTAALGATSTTEVVVLDAARSVVYRGAVDDQYGIGYALDAPRNSYLATALADLLADKQPTVAATTAPGCELDTPPAPATAVTYHGRVERLVGQRCVECHRAGGSAPFALETYEQVVARKGAMRRAVEDRAMPPWFAAPPAAGSHSPWLTDRSLPPADRADLLAWLGGDLKKGDPADAPLPRRFASGWLIGNPDAVFEIPRPIAVKAEGVMPYQHAEVETTFDDDRWVQAVEVQPTAREVVHHVLVFAGKKGDVTRGEAQGFFAVYVPGNNTLIYPDDYAKKLPKGAVLRFQIHYTPNGKAASDRSRVGVVFAKGPPKHEVRVAGIANAAFTIPPGAAAHKIEARVPVPWDVRVLAFFPHAHLRGKAARYEARFADGTTTTLLDVPHYDFNWQLTYRYAEPVRVPRGSSLLYTAWYDNSDKNPANPDPKKAVRWGPQTSDEMHLGYVEFVIDR